MDDFEGRLTTAYDAWHTSGGRTPARFFELYHESVELHSVLDTSPGFEPMRGPYLGKAAAIAYYTAIAEAWEMIEAHTERIVARHDTVVWVGSNAWRNLKTLRVVSGPKVDVWTVREGLATRYFELYDTHGTAHAMGLV